MVKKLTRDGLMEGVDEMEDVDTTPQAPQNVDTPKQPQPQAQPQPAQNPKPLNPQQKKEYQQRCNDDDRIKGNGLVVVNKIHLYLFIGLLALFVLGFVGNSVWHNLSFSKKDFSSNITVNSNPTINNPVNVQVNATFSDNANKTYILQLPQELSDALVKLINSTSVQDSNETNETS